LGANSSSKSAIGLIGGFVLTYVNGINDSGQVVGSYMNNNGVEEAFVASPVPTVEAALGAPRRRR
jgi:hypothetical protein